MNIYSNRAISYLIWRLILRNPRLRRMVTEWLVPNKDETINLIGNSIRINRIEEIGYWRAAKSQFSNVVFRDEVPTLMRLLGLIQPNTTFVDCGANVGLFSATVSHLQKIYCQLRIYSFEPHPHTFKRLTATLEGTRTEIRNFALSNREGTLEVFEGATSGVFGVASTQSHFQISTSKTEIDPVSFSLST